MRSAAFNDWSDADTELLDPEAREIPERLTREELLAASDAGWRRNGWRFDEFEDDQ
ncbi:hypothetical protein [Brevundimonas sp. M20]|uniref:hypothetical protein n=1 Tax=Brevundimonas sp. M20 TaxID=2591463 RepID=UPI00143CC7E6|nr:hypothetical protein [Brevundimonas sp. M20]